MEVQKNNNFLPLSRKILEHDLWHEKPFSKGQAWVDLLLLARWKDEPKTLYIKNTKYVIKRGQLLHSMKSLGERWGWDRAKVKRLINRLANEHQITHQSDNITTCITIVNYDVYNKGEHQMNIKRTSDEHQMNTKEEREEGKEYKFKGKVIKLIPKHYDEWKLEYLQLDLDKELARLDEYYFKQKVTNWYFPCKGALKKANENIAPKSNWNEIKNLNEEEKYGYSLND